MPKFIFVVLFTITVISCDDNIGHTCAFDAFDGKTEN